MNEKGKSDSRKTPGMSLFLMFAFALVGQSFASVFVKLAGGEQFLSTGFVLWFLVALAVLMIYALMWQLLLERVQLTSAFMFKGVTYILMLIWSVLIFHETITLQNIIGSALIIAGVAVNSRDL